MKHKLLIIVGFWAFLMLLGSGVKRGGEPWVFPSLKFFPPIPENVCSSITLESVELGRFLFYDPILSADSSISCSSCHKQEYAFSDSPRSFSKGAGPISLSRNTPPLFNLVWYPEFFWDGRATTLEEQVLISVRTEEEMNLPWAEAEKRVNNSKFYRDKFRNVFGKREIDSMMIVTTIAHFQTTLLSHNSKYDRVIRREDYLNELEYLGFNLMNDQTKGDCLHCHTTDGDALGTTRKYSNNGLDAVYNSSAYPDPGRGGVSGKNEDMGKFKIPSLRNITLTAPYMHDGRFKTLEEVLDFYSSGVHYSANVDTKMEFAHRGGSPLSEREKKAIIAMLYTLTDSVFISDPRYSNPFHQ